jgi:transketolase
MNSRLFSLDTAPSVETAMSQIRSSRIRRIILDQSWRARVGHVGSALSVADIVAVLYDKVLSISAPEDLERDRFILSKGHAALAVYAALHLRGWLTEEALLTYGEDGSLLGVHPDHSLRGVDFTTGSLGQGLPMAVGAALAGKLLGSRRRVFALLSDAECNEGSVWESVMFAAHHRLSNLVVIIDLNGQQATGYTRDVLDMTPMAEKWRAFHWDVHEIDGHNAIDLNAALSDRDRRQAQPRVVLARTVFGHGVSFMTNTIKWHYLPLSDEEYRRAIEEQSADQ